MALTKRTYVDGQTVITATNLNEIQDAIIDLEEGGGGAIQHIKVNGTEQQIADATVDLTVVENDDFEQFQQNVQEALDDKVNEPSADGTSGQVLATDGQGGRYWSDVSKDSEAWAVGQRGGVDVPSTDPAYHNNSKYYASESKDARDDIEDSIEGVAQEDTAQSALSSLTTIIGFLQTIAQRHEEVRYYDTLPEHGTEGYTYITPQGTFHFKDGEYVQLSGSGDLNGFSLNLGLNSEVILSYKDPDDETITDTIIMPTEDTINLVISRLENISQSLAKIAGREDTNES